MEFACATGDVNSPCSGFLESHKALRRFHNKIALVNTVPGFFVLGGPKEMPEEAEAEQVEKAGAPSALP